MRGVVAGRRLYFRVGAMARRGILHTQYFGKAMMPAADYYVTPRDFWKMRLAARVFRPVYDARAAYGRAL